MNTAITIADAKGIILNIDKTRLSEYSGHLNLRRAWAMSLLTRMGFVERCVTTKSSKARVENFAKLKAKFLSDVNIVVQVENIPPELIFIWDQTSMFDSNSGKRFDVFIIPMI